MPATFMKGDRVKMTRDAVTQGLAPWGRKGECFGIVTSNQNGLSVNVRRDGTKQTRSFHIGYWNRW